MQKFVGYVVLLAAVLVIGVGIGRLTTQAQQTGSQVAIVPEVRQEQPARNDSQGDKPAAVAAQPEKWIGDFWMGAGSIERLMLESKGTFRYHDKDFSLTGKWERLGNFPDGRIKLCFKPDTTPETNMDFSQVAYDKTNDRIGFMSIKSKKWWVFTRVTPASAADPHGEGGGNGTDRSLIPNPTPSNDYESTRAPGWIGGFSAGSSMFMDFVEIRANGIFRYSDQCAKNFYGRWREEGSWGNGRPKLVLKPDHPQAEAAYQLFHADYDQERDCLLLNHVGYDPADTLRILPRVSSR
jgi:hypothetical protein